MLNKFFKGFCVSTLTFVLLGSSVFAVSGKVTGSKVRIRENADSNSKEITVATQGEKVEVIGEEGDWYKINFENITGYISKDYVETDYSSEISNTTTEPTPNSEENITTTNSTEPEENNSITNEVQTQSPSEENTTVSNEVTETPTEESSFTNEVSSITEEQIIEHQEGESVIFSEETSLKYLPNFASRELVKAEKGSSYTIIAVLNKWVKVSNDLNSGWVLSSSIEENSPSETTPPEQDSSVETGNPAESAPSEMTRKGVVNVDSAKLRESPDGESLDSVKEGTEVTILGEEGDWYNISVGEYDDCYIAKRLITEK